VLPFFAEFGKVIAGGLPAPGPGAGRLLDVGTGRGALALPARALGYQVTAIDASAAMVARLAAGHPDLDVRLMNAAQLGFGDAKFDVVTAGFVMHLLDDPVAGVRAVRRVLKPGGWFAFTVPGQAAGRLEFAGRAEELLVDFSRYLPPGGGVGTSFEEAPALAAAGFSSVEESRIRVELPVADPETVWRWFQTHGTRQFLDVLDDARRAEFHRWLIAALESHDQLVLRRHARLFRARVARPGDQL
jgi:SAM-dependent methyltransferase